MTTKTGPRFVWRLAQPWDLILASLPKPTLMTSDDIDEIRTCYERDWGGKLDKPRPFGMLIDSDSTDTCRVFSRTADKNIKPNGVNELNHQDHKSSCRIDADGVVQTWKYVRLHRKYWDSPALVKPALNENSYILLCYCEGKSCRQKDKELIHAIQQSTDKSRSDK